MMIRKDPSGRISVEGAMEHAWFGIAKGRPVDLAQFFLDSIPFDMEVVDDEEATDDEEEEEELGPRVGQVWKEKAEEAKEKVEKAKETVVEVEETEETE